jgi:hypothetical protein
MEWLRLTGTIWHSRERADPAPTMAVPEYGASPVVLNRLRKGSMVYCLPVLMALLGYQSLIFLKIEALEACMGMIPLHQYRYNAESLYPW